MLTRGRPSLAAAGALAAVLGCARDRAAYTPAALAGCYAFAPRDRPSRPLGEEMPDTLRLRAAPHLNPDGSPHPFLPLALDVVAHRPGVGGDSLRLGPGMWAPWPPAWQRYYVLTAWRFTAPDSVRVGLHANMSDSWDLRLRAEGDSLVGRAEGYSDAREGYPVVAVVGRRVACPPAPRGGGQRAAI